MTRFLHSHPDTPPTKRPKLDNSAPGTPSSSNGLNGGASVPPQCGGGGRGAGGGGGGGGSGGFQEPNGCNSHFAAAVPLGSNSGGVVGSQAGLPGSRNSMPVTNSVGSDGSSMQMGVAGTPQQQLVDGQHQAHVPPLEDNLDVRTWDW